MMQLRAFAHLRAAELDGTLEAGSVGTLAGHQGLELTDLERLGEVLVVVQRLRAASFHVDQPRARRRKLTTSRPARSHVPNIVGHAQNTIASAKEYLLPARPAGVQAFLACETGSPA
ncbi:MAG TPA: hypothetical protein VMM76_03425 [Pirellulaceae bacterium]|nr:hypothetical protein [Pirellulaceae bacterium]